ncbi:MAG: hypothetical protein M3Q22_00050 [Actinomycetota bacterium]|nr:hypothetical protein [Actinomycetota bacterium]
MPEPAYLLAAIRAAGPQPRPTGETDLAALRGAAARAGRILVDLPGNAVALGWLEGSEPVAGADTGVSRIPPHEWLLLVFAAALRACWIDPDEHPYPGRAVAESQLFAAVGTLGPLRGVAVDGLGMLRHQKGALPKLRAAGYLADGGDGRVRLGHRIAIWSEREVATLRHVYQQMPAAPPAAEETA